MPTFRFTPPQGHHVLLRENGSTVRAGKTFKEPDEETEGLLATGVIELVDDPPKQPVDAQPPDRAAQRPPTTTT